MSSNVAVSFTPAEPHVVVFGRDEAGKPHASWFDAESAELAMKAADLMNMHVLKLETEEPRVIARELARGRVFASGRAFTPFVRASVYGRLVELAGQATGLAAVKPVATAEPVGAAKTRNGRGALLTQSKPKATACGDAGRSEAPASSPASVPTGDPRARSWDEIGMGSLVLATTGIEDGWWEAVVIGITGA